MSTQAQPSSPFSRLSRLAFPFRPTTSSPLSPNAQTEDWYIPYNGPYEPPRDERNTDSWGHLVSGWLMESDGGRTGHGHGPGHAPGQLPPRIRAMSNASRMTADEHNRKSLRVQVAGTRPDAAGGIGDVPVPARPRRSQEAPIQHRASFASILSFGKHKTAAGASQRQLHHSSSTGTLRGRERDDAPAHSMPYTQQGQDAIGRQEGSSASHSQSQALHPSGGGTASGFSIRLHPYAYATPAPLASQVLTSSPAAISPRGKTTKFSVQLLDPHKPTAPAYLLPASRPSRLSLKASMSTPNLRAATGTGSVLSKGKQRWLSAETWCDALILPRPRFTLKMIDGEGGSGRVVSPPPSPMWLPGTEPTPGRTPTAPPKSLKKSHSAIQLSSRPPPPSPLRAPPPIREEPPRGGPSTAPQAQPVPLPPPSTSNKKDTHLKPYRPKSWALDDLALPSPVPSLSKVLEEGRQLEEDRKAWQLKAAKSLDRRAGTISRARSKSIGSRAAPHAKHPSAFVSLTEATLLGSQRRRPTVHVRVKPPRSDGHGSSSGVGTNTITGTGTGTALGTYTSASYAQTKSRSHHGHSNSLGTISQTRSEESFLWTPGHGRNRSLGKSALNIVRATATTAAGLCGVNGSENDDAKGKGRPPLNDKAAAMEEALRHDGTKVIHLRDQVAREKVQYDGGIVVITPPPDSNNTHTTFSSRLGPGGANGASPTPSGMSTSAEGVGIAISTPQRTPPAQETFEKEPIRIPAHPYAQGSGSHPYYQRAVGRAPIQTNVRAAQYEGASPSPTGSAADDSITKHRQPVKVHPYSPYTQVQHPFAAVTGTDPGHSAQPTTAGKQQPSRNPESRSPQSSMFAELSPGTIREIMPDEIQYSPFISTPPVRLTEFATASGALTAHPYGPPSKRTSEWGFADALNYTMTRRASEDSGLGTSEAHDMPPIPRVPSHEDEPERLPFKDVLDDSDELVISPDQEDLGEEDFRPDEAFGSSSRPRIARERTGVSSQSNHTLASSPMEHVNPLLFRRKDNSTGERSFNSTRSSPGVVSAQSSPPLSPHLFQSNDLQEFKDLFYKPESGTPSDERPPISRNESGSIQIELNSRSTRSLSGLTNLARQLSVNIGEMQDDEAALEEIDRVSPMWGTRYGGLAGVRPDDLGPEPPEVLSQSSSRSGYRRDDMQSPLRLPLDEEMVLSQPMDVVPADVESSRASSMLEMPLEDNAFLMRVGEVEAVSTPSVYAQPQRFSTHLTEMDYDDAQLSPMDTRSRRAMSGRSSLGVPLSSDATRSSFMTNTSGMSRLSDFPAPPSLITASHLSILNAYYGEPSRDSQVEERDASRPELVREASQATFGSRQQMGEAL
ncbi:hypothetical protein BD311DRAFT_739615 [Dichomitus squalens]|uniref:Uncharacterized protein n=1 Tax=Dichomitus squalens TaxID=114155 RepID=A0A4Q9MM89_9APHY|nr:hypothetical protein BD311DRAFT_739615 [Dichomitus squalens]